MKKISDFESYIDNPSTILEEDIKRVHYFTKGDVVEIVDNNGEVVNYQKLGTEVNKVIDQREYRKVYVNELVTLKELSASGLKVFCYILKNLKVKKDDITISIADCMEFTGYKSKVNIYNGIVELLDKQIIYRKVGTGNYYININAIYNGARQ
jgi:hypothetical protein